MTLEQMIGAIEKAIAADVPPTAEIVCTTDNDGNALFYADLDGDWVPLEPPKELPVEQLGLQELAVALRITPLQVIQLNEIGSQIDEGYETYLSVRDSLSRAEDVYLRKWLTNAGMDFTEEEGE